MGEFKIPETSERRFLWAMPATPHARKRLKVKQGPSAEEQNEIVAQTILVNKPHIERLQKEIEEIRRKRRENEAQQQNTVADNELLQDQVNFAEEREQELNEAEVQNFYTNLRVSSRELAESSRGS